MVPAASILQHVVQLDEKIPKLVSHIKLLIFFTLLFVLVLSKITLN
eukprot:SAG11_NODE_24826_length_367_cov_1.343284_1_plen_45_part_10